MKNKTRTLRVKGRMENEDVTPRIHNLKIADN